MVRHIRKAVVAAAIAGVAAAIGTFVRHMLFRKGKGKHEKKD